MPDLLLEAPWVRVTRPRPGAEWLLHCLPADASTVGAYAGLALGDRLLASTAAGEWQALHLSPDEWLLVGPEEEGGTLAARLDLCPVPLSLVDISDRSLALEIEGAASLDLLSGGCPLDLEPLADGTCTRTLFGKAMVMLWRRGTAWRISYARSFDGYVTELVAAIAADLASERLYPNGPGQDTRGR